jgi:hypothetical protein
LATRKKKFPFRYGQRVKYKESESELKLIGIVISDGPAKLGKDGQCHIPGGPIIFEDMVLIEICKQGECRIYLEYIDVLESC